MPRVTLLTLERFALKKWRFHEMFGFFLSTTSRIQGQSGVFEHKSSIYGPKCSGTLISKLQVTRQKTESVNRDALKVFQCLDRQKITWKGLTIQKSILEFSQNFWIQNVLRFFQKVRTLFEKNSSICKLSSSYFRFLLLREASMRKSKNC